MITDALLILCGAISAAGALTGQAANGAGNIISTNTVDLAPLTLGGNQAGDTGAGQQLHVVFSILTAPTVGTSVQFQLIQADNAALDSGVQVLVASDVFLIAALPIRTQVPLVWDRAAPHTPKRYFGARIVNAGSIATFSVFATVVPDVQTIRNLHYASGFSIT